MKEARPTSGRVLLALFSILGSVEGLSFLDLFAGTGRVGMEALKRGVSSVVLVETLKNRAQEITRALPGEATVLALDVRRAVRRLKAQEAVFDLIFADPPYNEGWGRSLLETKDLAKLLKSGGTMIVEHATREPLTLALPWLVTDRREYGETTLTFLGLADAKGADA